jgi:hypothetical protein
MDLRRLIRRLPAILLAPALLAGCSDNTVSPATSESLVVVLNQGGMSLTLVPLGNSNIRTIQLTGGGAATTMAVRGERAVVPMGSANAAQVVNLRTRAIEHTVALPAGSGATGAAFVNDSIAVVANPGRNSVTPINVVHGTAGAEIAVGEDPRALVAEGARVYVVNATLNDAQQPSGPGTVTVLTSSGLSVVGTVQLTGLNPIGAVVRGTRLYVLNAGTDGGDNSSLSVVDAATRQELFRVDSMGNLPRGLTTLPGLPVFVAAGHTGLLAYDPEANTMLRGVGNPFLPAEPPVSAARLDDLGLLYSLHPGSCAAPGVLVQIGSSGSVLAQATVGVCPVEVGFATLPL